MSQTRNHRIRQRILEQTLSALLETWGAEKILTALSHALEDHDSKRLLLAAAAAEREAMLADVTVA